MPGPARPPTAGRGRAGRGPGDAAPQWAAPARWEMGNLRPRQAALARPGLRNRGRRQAELARPGLRNLEPRQAELERWELGNPEPRQAALERWELGNPGSRRAALERWGLRRLRLRLRRAALARPGLRNLGSWWAVLARRGLRRLGPGRAWPGSASLAPWNPRRSPRCPEPGTARPGPGHWRRLTAQLRSRGAGPAYRRGRSLAARPARDHGQLRGGWLVLRRRRPARAGLVPATGLPGIRSAPRPGRPSGTRPARCPWPPGIQ